MATRTAKAPGGTYRGIPKAAASMAGQNMSIMGKQVLSPSFAVVLQARQGQHQNPQQPEKETKMSSFLEHMQINRGLCRICMVTQG